MIDTGQKLAKEMEIQVQEVTNTFHLRQVTWGNVNNCIEKRESNATAKHPTDIELIAWKNTYLYIKGILEEPKTRKKGEHKDVSASQSQMSLFAEDRLKGS